VDVVTEPVAEALPPAEPTASPNLVAGHAPLGGTDPAADADLSNRERELLRQLHEELAKREQSEPPPEQAGWQQERQPEPPGTAFDPNNYRPPEFNPNEFGGPAWRQAPGLDSVSSDQTAVNGIPPYRTPA